MGRGSLWRHVQGRGGATLGEGAPRHAFGLGPFRNGGRDVSVDVGVGLEMRIGKVIT